VNNLPTHTAYQTTSVKECIHLIEKSSDVSMPKNCCYSQNIQFLVDCGNNLAHLRSCVCVSVYNTGALWLNA